MNKVVLLFLIILIEGYVVLACELLAIRQLIPFVGSGTETISIVISAVLLPLAIGYHFGGKAFNRTYQSAKRRGEKQLSIRKLLLKNIVGALFILAFGLSYAFMEIFFGLMSNFGIHHRLAQTAIYVSLFLVWPVFVLGQTVPLVSNYFSRRKLSEITGKMLFFSTAGSFLGSVFSTIVLMAYIGVHNTVIITLGLLVMLCLLLSRRMTYEPVISIGILCVIYFLNNNSTMHYLDIVSDNAYNTVSIIDLPKEEAKILNINRSNSSKVSKNQTNNFSYWKYIESTFIAPMPPNNGTPREILVIGAGGFTIGINDSVNHYTYVDIDKDLKRISEMHFLPDPLAPNKSFVVASARAFVRNDAKQYDFILIDVFTNIFSIPMEATTREFLLDVKKRLKKDGIVVANVVAMPTLRDKFSVRYNNTFASVFPTYTRQIIDAYVPWPGTDTRVNHGQMVNNILYIYFNHDLAEDRVVYTDDLNTYSLDRN